MHGMDDPDREHALDIGWEMIKLFRRPEVYVWLADQGWEGGFAVSASPHPEGVAVSASRRFEPLILMSPGASQN